MADAMSVSITIGAALNSSFRAVTGGAKKTLDGLGKTATALTAKQKELGKAIKEGLFVRKNVDGLRREYDRIGAAIDRTTKAQNRLNASMAKGAQLKDERARLRGDMMDATGTAVAVGLPAYKSVRLAGSFEDMLRDIAITGEMSRGGEASLGKSIRANAVRFNQYQEDVAQGIGVLVAGGVSQVQELVRFTPVIAKAATATRANVDELGAVILAMRDNLHIAAQDSEPSLNILAYAGKRGQFEIRDMAKWLPALAPQVAALGLTGKEAVAEIGAALQIARKGAGSNDEAANNFRNFLDKVTKPDTLRDFDKAGINLKKTMGAMVKDGFTPMEAMMKIITSYMGTKGPAAAKDLQAVLAIKDKAEQQAALNRLGEAYKLGELFQDQQAMAFIRPMLANGAEFKSIKQGALAASGQDILGADMARRLDAFNERWKGLTVRTRELGITIGDALLPPLSMLVDKATPVVHWAAGVAERFPRVTAVIAGMGTALVLAKVALVAGAYAGNIFSSGLVAVNTVVALFTGKLALLSAVAGVSMGTVVLVGAALVAAGVAIYKYWKPLSGFFKGLWRELKTGLTGFIKETPRKMFQAGKDLVRFLIDGMREMRGELVKSAMELGATVKKHLSRPATENFWPVPFAAPTSKVSAPGQSMKEALAAASSGGDTRIVYSPQISIKGSSDPTATRRDVDQALQLSQVEFERMLARADRNGERRRFATA